MRLIQIEINPKIRIMKKSALKQNQKMVSIVREVRGVHDGMNTVLIRVTWADM